MESATVPAGAVTFLFSDIEGSTSLWERSPDTMHAAVAEHVRLIRETIEANDGIVFKTVGDEVCSVFGRADRAVNAAVASQRSLHQHKWPGETGELRVRIGVHTGNAIAIHGDYFGPAVNRVARIMSAGHGGQILLSGVTASLVRKALSTVMLRDLGVHRLKDLTVPEELFQPIADGLENDFPALATLDSHPNNLPTHVSNFVGRDSELADLRRMLREHRLITIAGPGGIGKTRIALQLAADAIGDFRDGVWFVNLAEIDDPDLVAQRVSSALHVNPAPGAPIEQRLNEYLTRKQALIVLDNSELLLAQTAVLSRGLLMNCPQITVLVTSREPLHVSGEAVLRVAPMKAADETATLAELEQFDATRLFLERMRLVAPGRPSSPGDARAIRNICTRLDGIPLAIEMAAARAGSMSVQELDHRLQSNLKLLVSKDPSEAARHRTVAVAIDWSYRILSKEERRLFAGLSVFDGGFSLAAFEALMREDIGDDAATDRIEPLVDKSFVTTRVEHGTTRYRLLEPLRDFALEEAAKLLSLDDLRKRHFEYFKGLAGTWETQQNAEDELAYYERIERDIANFRAALAWGLAQPDLDPAFAMLLNVAPYWQLRGHTKEARAWFERALQSEGHLADGLRAAALRKSATFATIDGAYESARDLSERGRKIFDEIGDAGGAAEAIHNLAVIEHVLGRQELARALYSQAHDAFAAVGHTRGVMTVLYNLGQISAEQGDFEDAKAFFERGLVACMECEQEDKRASFLSALAHIATKEAEYPVAADLYAQALKIKHDVGNATDAAEILVNMAALAMKTGNSEQALAYVRESVQIALALDSRSVAVDCVESFAVILAKLGRTQEAASTLAFSEALREEAMYFRRDVRFADELRDLRAPIADSDFSNQVVAAQGRDWHDIASELLLATPAGRPAT